MTISRWAPQWLGQRATRATQATRTTPSLGLLAASRGEETFMDGKQVVFFGNSELRWLFTFLQEVLENLKLLWATVTFWGNELRIRKCLLSHQYCQIWKLWIFLVLSHGWYPPSHKLNLSLIGRWEKHGHLGTSITSGAFYDGEVSTSLRTKKSLLWFPPRCSMLLELPMYLSGRAPERWILEHLTHQNQIARWVSHSFYKFSSRSSSTNATTETDCLRKSKRGNNWSSPHTCEI